MVDTIAVALIAIFVALSLIHFFWALGGTSGKVTALPEVSGHPAFRPSTASTVIVAVGLALCAVLVAATANLLGAPFSTAWLKWLSFALAVALFARAIGDFRLVGFFKRVRGTRFAHLDTILFSPLCLVLGAGVFYVAYSRNT